MAQFGFRLLYGFFWLFTLLPLRIQYVLADLIYLVLYYVVGYRKQVTFTNLRNSFPDKPDEVIRSIAHRFYRHLGDLIIEIMALIHMDEKDLEKRVVFRNLDLIQKYYHAKRNIAVVGGHTSNWEWSIHFPLHTPYKNLVLYRHLPEQFNRMFRQFRTRYGYEPVDNRNFLKHIYEYQTEGILTATWLIFDQRPLRSDVRYWVKFLNQDTAVSVGTEKLIRKINAPVIFVNFERIRRGFYSIEFQELVKEPGKTREFEITDRIWKKLEESIRNKPEYWFWSHRRWKFKKADFEGTAFK